MLFSLPHGAKVCWGLVGGARGVSVIFLRSRMKNYRPILLQNLAVTVPGVRVRQVRLNQHTPEAVWSMHAHEHGQLLVYLAGRGRQMVGGSCMTAGRGRWCIWSRGRCMRLSGRW